MSPQAATRGLQGLTGDLSLLSGGNDVFDLAEVDLADDFGLAVNALAIAGVVIGVAVDLFNGEARHI